MADSPVMTMLLSLWTTIPCPVLLLLFPLPPSPLPFLLPLPLSLLLPLPLLMGCNLGRFSFVQLGFTVNQLLVSVLSLDNDDERDDKARGSNRTRKRGSNRTRKQGSDRTRARGSDRTRSIRRGAGRPGAGRLGDCAPLIDFVSAAMWLLALT